ncbi:hypothetical protein [uncultured Mycobacterium sp.]|uniref:hypothetical protein n=1 Tax=uncultured Mycobacterium sp. TaxID=171292 RepID=UPI0035CAFC4A
MARRLVELGRIGDAISQRGQLGVDDVLHDRIGGQCPVGGQHGVAVGDEVVELGVQAAADLFFERSIRAQPDAVEQPLGRPPVYRREQCRFAGEIAVQQRP